MSELRECPFCGSCEIQIDEMESFIGDEHNYWRVLCIECIASINGDTRQESIAAWNRRTPC
jgi:Lar family restriction alleviation protein